MVDQDDKSLQAYLIQHRFPEKKYGGSLARYLLELQSTGEAVIANIECAGLHLQSSEDLTIKIDFVSSPIASFVHLELQLYPIAPTQSALDVERHEKERVSVAFSTYDNDSHGRYHNRTPFEYKSNLGNQPPNGPFDFSNQLLSFEYHKGDHQNVKVPSLHKNMTPADQLYFSWRAKTCTRFGFGIAAELPAKRHYIQRFAEMIDKMIQDGSTMNVVARPVSVVRGVSWPWFAAVPSPVPESYFPWLKPFKHGDPSSILEIRPNGDPELWPLYIKLAFAKRAKGWIKSGLEGGIDFTKVPDPLQIGRLDQVVKFRDEREYLAHILIGYLYEEFHSTQTLKTYLNGLHQCRIMVQDTIDVPRYLLLLNIRPPRVTDRAQAAEGFGLPEEGERVSINIRYNNMDQVWTGKAEFHFGHYGSPTHPVRDCLTSIMLADPPEDAWWKAVLLAQDNYINGRQPNELTDPSLSSISNWKTRVMEVCQKRGLNKDQIEVIQYYFTHRLTIVRGPPGTGKSTLIDALVELESIFHSQLHVCCDSNAAVGVLVNKTCKRTKSVHPKGYFRVKPAFEENLTIDKSSGRAYLTPLALPSSVDDLPEEKVQMAIDELFAAGQNTMRAMSLENTILERSGTATGKPRWETEKADLDSLMRACLRFEELKVEGRSPEVFDMEKQRYEKDYMKELRGIQQKYLVRARAIFSTNTAASGSLLRKIKPTALIMDEASQSLEAKAVSVVVHALRGKKLRRVLLIGDDKQLPPTVTSPRNPFSLSGEVSLFERLIKSGFASKILSIQYRMHPQISRIVNDLIYSKLSGFAGLIDSPVTQQGLGVGKFQAFIKTLAAHCVAKNVPQASHSVVISPTRDPKKPDWFKSKRQRGSTSRYNLTTARIVFQLAYRLIQEGGYEAQDIMIISFYADQVSLLKALFQGFKEFKSMRIMTVDSSQGSESEVVIVDCVLLGAANGDGMGFLGHDMRRLNVALSRAQKGRITIAHQDMIAKGDSSKTWKVFLEQAARSNSILSGAKLNEDLAHANLHARLVQVYGTWLSRENPVAEKQVGHENVARDTSKESTSRPKPKTDRTRFIELTGCDDKDAAKYLAAAKVDFTKAIQLHYEDNATEDDVEEIERMMSPLTSPQLAKPQPNIGALLPYRQK